jgi:RNA polymerase sigma-70 factor (ECF subfamily)
VPDRRGVTLVRLRRPAATTAEDPFREVVEANEAAVHAFLRRRVQDPGRAEDLTQEVFLRAWRHAEQYDARRADVRGWLLGIARNLLIDTYRADAARPRTTGDDELLAGLAATDETDAAVASLSMADALHRLSTPHRDVLLCLYYRRWSLADTAAHLGVPMGTVKSRSTYALRALKLVLEEMEGSE